jgi:hypothetical protein
MAQVTECLSSKYKALSPKPSSGNNKKTNNNNNNKSPLNSL